MKQLYDVIVIGGGPGGYTAALYCARAGLHTVILEKMMPGGQMALTEQIDNYPGFDQGVDGFTLGQQMKNGAERFGAETRTADVLSVKLEGEIKEVETTDGIVSGRVVILATGAATRELGLPGEKELVGRGVSYCATCDGMFFRGKTVVVVGGGNSAAADAMVLSRVCEKVILVHRQATLHATRDYHNPPMEAENGPLRWNSTVTELLQEGRLTGVKVKDTITGEETVVPCDGLFVSIGRAPASELVKGVLELDEAGYVKADESTRTSIPGVFAVGDVRTKVLRQIITAAADGAVASHYADEYLASKN